MVVIDFFNLNTLFPVGQDPLSTMSDEITSPGNTQQIKFSVGYNRLAVFVPFVLGCVVPGWRFLQAIGMVGSAVILGSNSIREGL